MNNLSASSDSLTPQPVDVTLSQEELLLILSLLQRNMLFGLDLAATTELSLEQRTYGQECANRALRARGLAQIGEDGSLLIQGDVLNVVGTCALAQQVFVVHFAGSEGSRDRMVAYRMDNQAVVQTIPGLMLYRFVTLPSVATMLTLLGSALVPDQSALSSPPELQLAVSADSLKEAQTLASAGNANRAAAALANDDYGSEAPATFAQLLAKPHNIAVLHVITRLEGDQVASQEVTVISDPQSAWFMFEQANNGGGLRQYQVATLSQERLADVLASLVSQPA